MAELLKGAPVVAGMNARLEKACDVLNEKGVLPTLALVRVGNKEDDIAYERGVEKRAATIGVLVQRHTLQEDVPEGMLLDLLRSLNEDIGVHGILLFRPLPKHMDDTLIRNAILPEKDVDGITDGSLAGVFTSSGEGFAPCTAQACVEVLEHYGYTIAGKRVVVIGRSLVVGKPLAMLLMDLHATVTICHTRTVDMPTLCKEADILIVAAGSMHMVDERHLREGQIVLDVGIHLNQEGGLSGDVNFIRVEPIVKAITPVPGGIGAVTTSVLLQHVVEAAKKAIQ